MKLRFQNRTRACQIFVLLALSVTASADVISDSLVVKDATGAVVASVSATESQEASNSAGFVYIIPDSSLIDATLFGNFTEVLEGSRVSDIFGIASGIAGCSQTFCLAFASDTETAPVPFSGASNTFQEGSGGPFDATMYLAPSLRTAGYHAAFTSDSDATVPEPSTFVLFVTMLGAMLLAVRIRIAKLPA